MADDKEEKYAPGMDDENELNEEATKKEKRKGEYTKVTKLSYDEADPS
ncbi:hypothetical protein [Bacillus marinisedimentorum]|nr:hypothetical protein [Bacillus marinisedimentorum]